MPYLKHPTLGNRHCTEAEASELEANGWTRFPRSQEAKALGSWPINAAPQETGQQSVSAATVPTPVGAAPSKRKYTRKGQ